MHSDKVRRKRGICFRRKDCFSQLTQSIMILSSLTLSSSRKESISELCTQGYFYLCVLLIYFYLDALSLGCGMRGLGCGPWA